MDHTVREIAATGLSSLAWAGDDLVDWIGGVRMTAAGDVRRFNCGYSYRFDAAVGRGDVAAMFETLGTKGRLVRLVENPGPGAIGFDEVREIDRGYYHAQEYAFPACILELPDGRGAIAHCPRRYDTLELELLDGTPLTRRPVDADDVFHSRLAASPDGRWLLSAGWVWQPWNVACVYDVARALVEPAHLSSSGIRLDLGAFEAEVDAAALSGDPTNTIEIIWFIEKPMCPDECVPVLKRFTDAWNARGVKIGSDVRSSNLFDDKFFSKNLRVALKRFSAL